MKTKAELEAEIRGLDIIEVSALNKKLDLKKQLAELEAQENAEAKLKPKAEAGDIIEIFHTELLVSGIYIPELNYIIELKLISLRGFALGEKWTEEFEAGNYKIIHKAGTWEVRGK